MLRIRILVQRIAHGTRHLAVTRHLCNLCISRNAALRNLLDRLIDALRRTVCHKFVTERDHAPDLLVRDASIQDHGVPMLLILMVRRDDCRVCAAPDFPPVGIHFQIQID